MAQITNTGANIINGIMQLSNLFEGGEPIPQQQFQPQQQQAQPNYGGPAPVVDLTAPEVPEDYSPIEINVGLDELDQAVIDAERAEAELRAEMRAHELAAAQQGSDYGGPMDLYNRGVRLWNNARDSLLGSAGVSSASSTRRVRDSVSKVSQSLGQLVDRVTANSAQIRAQARFNVKQSGEIAALRTKWIQRFGPQYRVQRVALSVLQALPGLRAQDVLNSKDFASVMSGIEEMASEVTDMGVFAPLTTSFDELFPATYTADPETDFGDIVKELRERYAALELKHNTDMAKIWAALSKLDKHKVAAAAEGVKIATTEDTLTTFSRLAPGQYSGDREEALMESVGRFLFGSAPGTGGSTLGGLLGITI